MVPHHDRRRFWYLRRAPHTIREDVADEIQLHVEMRVEELRARGMSEQDARREALRRFGSIERTLRYCQQQDERRENAVQRTLMLQDVVQDIRVSLRSLLRDPLLASIILATVGLGIGATTVIVSAIDVAFLRPLPYQDSDRLVWIYTDAPPFEWRFSAADYLALDTQQSQFERVAAFTGRTMTFNEGTAAHLLLGREVSWTYFRTLGIVPALGRDFARTDGTPGSPHAAIVSHGFWQQQIGARSDAIGRPIRLDGTDYVLAGVLPAKVGPLEQRQDFFIAAQFGVPPRRGPFLYWVVGRLKPGTAPSAAADELGAINRRIFPIWKSSYQDEKATWSLLNLQDRLVSSSRRTAVVALAAAAFVWLIACVNASSLLVARVTSRRRELAVRAALGASRGRVVRLLLVENGLLAAGAAAVGLALTPPGIALMRHMGASYVPRTQELALDGSVLGVLAAVTFLSLLVFGLVPSMHGLAGPIDESLHAEGRSSTGSRATQRLRRVLVGSQFAISTPLLIASALLLVSLNELRQVDLGFDGRPLITGAIRLPGALYRDESKVIAVWDELARRVARVAGVSRAAFADSLPPDGADNINNFDLEDSPTAPGGSQPSTPWVAVTPPYFRVLGLELLEGRLLEDRDARSENLEAVVVDRAWARRFFPGRSAIGKRFKEGGCSTCPWTTVVGVVSDVRYSGLSGPHHGTVYWPLAGGLTRFLVVRTEGEPRALIPSVREVVHAMEPDAPLTSVATIDDLVAQSLETPGSLTWLVAAFAIVALMLSAIGIYGVMAYFVQQNRKNISIRLALGGSVANVRAHVIRHGMTAVVSGVAVGMGLALATTHLLASLLFGVTAADIPTYLWVGLLLLTVSLFTCLVPAYRATRVQPAAVLRDE
jgi:putative ABC transport system permease protein